MEFIVRVFSCLKTFTFIFLRESNELHWGSIRLLVRWKLLRACSYVSALPRHQTFPMPLLYFTLWYYFIASLSFITKTNGARREGKEGRREKEGVEKEGNEGER